MNTMLYADVPIDSSHFQNIMEARTLGLMTGYPENRFGPSVKLNRANVVKAFGKYIEQTTGKKVSEYDLSGVEPFSDVPPDSRDQELYQYSLLVKKEGIFQGSKNRLMPAEFISRRQMAMVLVRAFDLPDLPDVKSKVTDLSPEFGEEDRRAIHILSKHRITSVSEFRPRETTSRGQFASFLVASYHAVHDEYPPPEVIGVEVSE
ncbi:S-layer homology domain-containing protein [Bhargavaea ullalensis]|uniref:SLH domain-containing protein n=1 Tax=Bhargavaea ullalensis TaxID=1265685 RepID=A0ABV2GB85_9BACL